VRDAVRPLREQLAGCSIADRWRLDRRLRELDHHLRHGRHQHGRHDPAPRLAWLREEVEKAAAALAARRSALPKPRYPSDLPIVERKDEIAAAIRDHQVVIVCGETGSGKSTQLPKICLELGRGVEGLIGHTQPRRIAARSIAQRLSEELGSPLGKAVGYKVRFTDRTSPDSFVKVMTDGVLLAETQRDRALLQYDTIIIDEAHERSLNIDFLLGYLKLLLPRRPELRVIVTSATIDPQRFSEHFAGSPPASGAPMIEVSGRTYPVETRYRPLRSDDPDEEDRTLEHAILDAVDELCALDRPDDPGDILVFIPGEREIRETADELHKHHFGPQGSPRNPHHPSKTVARTEVIPLYARLSADEQHRVFEPHPGVRRIVLATNVAETSLTVPGIRYVVDTGLARVSRFSSRSRVQALPIEPVSQASANQRAGRCGRTGPGVCIRLYSEQDFAEREPFTPPEIVRTNLASVILQMKALRLGEIESFPFVEAPNARAVQEGYDTLTELGAVDDRGRLTQLGEQMAKLPIDPRIARMVLAGEKEGCLAEVLVIAAALSVQDPRDRSLENREASEKALRRFINAHLPRPAQAQEGAPIPGVARPQEDPDPNGSDFMVLVNIWREFQQQRDALSSNQLRKWCKAHYLGYMRMREWADVHAQLLRLVTQLGHKTLDSRAEEGHVHRALLTGLLVNIGRYDEDAREYAGAQGAKFSIFPGSAMFGAKAKWIMAAERVRTTRVYARTVARVRPEWIEELAPHLVKRSHTDATWNERTGTVHVFETVYLFGLEIIPRRRANLADLDRPAARQMFIQNALLEGKYHLQGRFVEHNQRILNEARRLEAKARRRDLMADTARRFEFFDKRLPDKIAGGGPFDRWCAHAERQNPTALCMTLSDVMRPDAVLPAPDAVPDALNVSGASFPLSYRFEPGEADDGVTIMIPLAALGGIDPGPLEWLVPAWAREKVETLVRGLPKEFRRAIGPTPQAVDAFLATSPDRSRSLLEQLAQFLSQSAGCVVPASALAAVELPAHMSMRILVTDSRGRPIAAGRDLRSLREQLRAQIGASLAGVSDRRFNRSGLGDWEFGDIPERVMVDAGGVNVPAFPALVDEGKAVGLRLFDSLPAAQAAMRAGLRRLFALRVRGEIKAAVEHAPGVQRLASLWGPHSPTADLNDQLALMVSDRVFLSSPRAEDNDIRTFQRFTQHLNDGFGSIVTASLDAVATALPVLESLQRATLLLEAMDTPQGAKTWGGTIDGVRNQLAHLCPRGFLVSTRPTRLARLAVYLRGAESRLQKVRAGRADNDQRWAAELRPHLRRWLDVHDRTEGLSPTARAALDDYRWMLEEFRLSLFAQELRSGGAQPPVSVRRLDELWQLVSSG